MHIISLGAGVQSSCLALMAKHGEILPMPKCAIFADTGGEPKAVYEYLEFLEKELPFPVHKIMHKDGLTKSIERAATGDATRSGNPPFFTKQENSGGILSRVCTVEFKINPIKKFTRQLLGLKPRQRAGNELLCTQWIGISLDEIQRLRESKDKWMELRYPLIEKRMRRGDCIEWMKSNGYPEPPRSACVYCPYHSDKKWRDIKNNDAEGWQEAVRIDRLIRKGLGTTKSELYVHNTLKPLDEVDFTNDTDRGQLTFLDECSGMCGI